MSTRVQSVTFHAAIALLLACAPLLTGRAGVGAQAPVDISLQPRVENISSLIWQGSFRVGPSSSDRIRTAAARHAPRSPTAAPPSRPS